ncbi:hypothetical protein HPG69_000296 [Diceros bicornis minor]|uniref:Uncharacterized protein n=1 Tax=Diceros bicornis minor TaxID=77932 RepID=A0A7J7EV34_DICBM|nr:hypothetical protein HPG69_000296 [Diceros bicornis minor]
MTSRAAQKLKDKEVVFWTELLAKEATEEQLHTKHVELPARGPGRTETEVFYRGFYGPKRYLIVEAGDLSFRSGERPGRGNFCICGLNFGINVLLKTKSESVSWAGG